MLRKGSRETQEEIGKPKLGIAPKYFKNVYLSYKNNTWAAT